MLKHRAQNKPVVKSDTDTQLQQAKVSLDVTMG